MQTIEECYGELMHEVDLVADSTGRFKGEAFFEIVARHLSDAGEIETYDRAHFNDRKGTRIDGYGGHPADSDGVLTLIVQDFAQYEQPEGIPTIEVERAFAALLRFAAKSTTPDFRNSLEESAPGFQAALQISGSWADTRRIKLILITNRKLPRNFESIPTEVQAGKEIVRTIWDLERLCRYIHSGREREELELDLESDYGGAIPVLPAHVNASGYEAFLAVVRGEQLAAIYDRWGSRLLEQNVRSFLQLKGSVNKGIAKTIRDEPAMFFAYNNGITATAESVVLTDDGRNIAKVRNLQIVNGGQTTASLHLQRTKGADLRAVFVQMKLSIVDPIVASAVVPRISEYANTQNKVNAADFFANHPFHIELERCSRRILAPAQEGQLHDTRWFYERSRGQFVNERSRLAESARKKFDREFPKTQLITKTDLAKSLNLWPGHVGIDPSSVCRGAQKTFSDFAQAVSRRWTDASVASINEAFFRDTVAKMIVFREMEKIVSTRPWYQSGYRAQLVAHAIGRLAWEVDSAGNVLDYDRIWTLQGLPPLLRDALIITVDAISTVVINPPVKGQNISEWAKLQACWKQVQDVELRLPSKFAGLFLTKSEADSRTRRARREQREVAGIEAQSEVVDMDKVFWSRVLSWGIEQEHLTPSERRILEIICRPGTVPSDRQAHIALQVLQRLSDEGFVH